MTASRWLAGLASLLTAMLLQATVIGPLLVPLPASLPLVVVAAIAVLTGPSTGITLGFAAGLLTDLGSHHPVGVLALTWLGVGVAAGVIGGMVAPVEAPRTVPRRSTSTARRLWTSASLSLAWPGRYRPVPIPVRSPVGSPARNRRRSQALLVGLLGGVGAAATAIVLAVVGSGDEPLATALLRCVPGGLLDAILALLVLPAITAGLRSPSLRAPIPLAPHRSPDAWARTELDVH